MCSCASLQFQIDYIHMFSFDWTALMTIYIMSDEAKRYEQPCQTDRVGQAWQTLTLFQLWTCTSQVIINGLFDLHENDYHTVIGMNNHARLIGLARPDKH